MLWKLENKSFENLMRLALLYEIWNTFVDHHHKHEDDQSCEEKIVSIFHEGGAQRHEKYSFDGLVCTGIYNGLGNTHAKLTHSMVRSIVN